ncbi:hypothetical protein [Nocardioides sp. cx-173]|uniref:hypothetical protein n=1 Tax=Nocardioides sp. cx-173 TaxID=2898796 RepID=UPI001E2F41A0|nr:hypothetical protein [Nocardioides sp. cx-173]MCD4525931.1 hypothetical protein [Nocardioides sp. cx-173]UGB40082.1 hypothetical protein LQ940_11790 [Nocardioides sp. cx-173]
MTDQLRHLLRDEAQHLDVPLPPVHAILQDGRRRRRSHRTRGVLAVAASVAVAIGGIGVASRLGDEGRGGAPDPADRATSAPTSAPTSDQSVVQRPVRVSGNGVGDQAFGAPAEGVLAAVTTRLGEPDLTVGPISYAKIPGSDGWFEQADDPTSLSWGYPVVSVACWGQLCLVFGGDEAGALALRGWELSDRRRWAATEDSAKAATRLDVSLAGSGLRLGDSWQRLHAAYPGTVVGGGEGASVVVDETPWPGIFDGVGAWRLSGTSDGTRPRSAPAGAVVTRLSAGEGPEPGCC